MKKTAKDAYRQLSPRMKQVAIAGAIIAAVAVAAWKLL